MHDSTLDDSSTSRGRGAMPRSLWMRYEVERRYLTDEHGRPKQALDGSVLIDAESSAKAAQKFVRKEGARLLGPVCDAPGDLCTATAWKDGRLYVITVWRVGHRPPGDDGAPAAN